MTPMPPDGEGEAPGVLTMQRTPTATDPAGAVSAHPRAGPARGALAAAVVIGMIAAAIFQQGGFYPQMKGYSRAAMPSVEAEVDQPI